MVSILCTQIENHGILKHIPLLLVLSIDCINRLRKASLKNLFSTSRTQQNVLMIIILADVWVVIRYIMYTNGQPCTCMRNAAIRHIKVTTMIRLLRGDQS